MRYQEIIDKQIQYKKYYKTKCNFSDVVSIEIQNNEIHNIVKRNAHPSRSKQYVKFIENMLKTHNVKDCVININCGDHPIDGIFNFCRRPNQYTCFLLPFARFTENDILITSTKELKHYDDIANYFKEQNKSKLFNNKISKCFCNGILLYGERLKYVKYAMNNLDKCDVYCNKHPVHSWGGEYRNNNELIQKIQQFNKGGSDVQPFEHTNNYKYVMYIDGNAMADRLRLILMLNSVPIMLKSKWEEFYTYLLKQDGNYIQCESVEELGNIIDILETDVKRCESIIRNNQEFMEKYMKYDYLLEYAANLINAIC